MRKRAFPTKAIPASTLKTRTGDILKALGQRNSFLLLRRNRPIGILQSLEAYVAERPEEYEDVEDYIETWLEEHDPEFKKSLRRARNDYRRGIFLTPAQVRLRLTGSRRDAA